MKLGDNNSEVNIDVIVTSYNSEKYIACAIE
jgi:hypothetical protein